MADLMCSLGPDSAGTVLTRLLRRAQRSIDAAFYEVGPSYAWLFRAAARRGVAVRLILDAHSGDGNRETATAVSAAGGSCRVGGAGASVFHPKLLVVDGSTVALGTGNLVWRDAPRARGGRVAPEPPPLAGTREWWVVVSGGRAAGIAARELGSAWEAATTPPESWRLAVPRPEPGQVGTPVPQVAPATVRVADRRIDFLWGGHAVFEAQQRLIDGAGRRTLLTVPYLHTGAKPVRSLVTALQDASRRGVAVAVLLGAPPEAHDRRALLASGLSARVMDAERSTRGHAKGMVVDDGVLVSSANWSSSGLGVNWEAALLVRHHTAAAYFAAAWHRDWHDAAPL